MNRIETKIKNPKNRYNRCKVIIITRIFAILQKEKYNNWKEMNIYTYAQRICKYNNRIDINILHKYSIKPRVEIQILISNEPIFPR